MFTVNKFTRDDFGDNSYQESHAGRFGVLPEDAMTGGGFGQPDPNACVILTSDEEYADRFATALNAAAATFIKANGEPPDEDVEEEEEEEKDDA